MVFLLFLLSGVIVANILLTLFFPFPAPLIGLGLQALFCIISLIVFISRIRRRKGMIGSFIMAALHSSAFVLITYLFFSVTLPNREEGEQKAFEGGLKTIRNYFNGEIPQIPSVTDLQNGKYSSKNFKTQNDSNDHVEDPF